MLTALIFALTLASLCLLMLGERMGLPVEWALGGSHAMIAAAALAIASLNMTSRLGRFVIGHERGGRLSGTALASILLLTGLMLFRSSSGAIDQIMAVFAGWALALLLVGARPWRNFRTPPADPADSDPLAGGSGAGRVAGFAVLVLMLAVAVYLSEMSRQAWQPILLGNPGGSLAGLAVVTAALLVLGGTAGLGRLALVAFTLTLVAAILPMLTTVAGGVGPLADGIAMARHELVLMASGGFREFMKQAQTGPVLLALVAGFAFGTASGQALAVVGHGGVRLVCIIIAAGLAFFVFGLLAFADVFLVERMVARLQGQSPSQWPAYVFDPSLKGWMKACGAAIQDEFAVAVACGTGTARNLLPAGALVVDPALGRPALAVSLGWPVLVGHIWVVLPAWLSLIGFLALIQACATGLSERLVFRLLRPRALRSTRLAYVRIAILAMALLLMGKEWGWGQIPADSLVWLMLGAVFLLAISLLVRATEGAIRLRRRRRPQPAPFEPTPLEAS